MILPPPRSTLFPYTTLFRSLYADGTPGEIFVRMAKEGSVIAGLMDSFATAVSLSLQHGVPLLTLIEKFKGTRSEEHTSELQSQSNLVCRLLLEKKNKA